MAPVRGWGWGDRSARAAGNLINVAGFAIVSSNDVDLAVRIFIVLKIAARIHILAEVHVSPVGG